MADDQLVRTFVELADTLVDDFDLLQFLHILVDRCVTLLDVSATGLLLADSHDGFRTVHALPMRLRSQIIGWPTWRRSA